MDLLYRSSISVRRRDIFYIFAQGDHYLPFYRQGEERQHVAFIFTVWVFLSLLSLSFEVQISGKQSGMLALVEALLMRKNLGQCPL
jgi:hypothetical protein